VSSRLGHRQPRVQQGGNVWLMVSRFGSYGMPAEQPSHQLYTQELRELHSQCTFGREPVERAFPSFIMNHFADNVAYDEFRGIDFTPHNLDKYPEHSHWREGLRPHSGGPAVVGGICELPPKRSGDLHHTLMRVGPFTSNGGYDWWQFAGHDVLNMSRHLAGGRTIGLNVHWVTAINAATGSPLGYPPMHVHHIHLVPTKPWLRYQWATHSTSSWRDVLEHMSNSQGAAYYVPNYVAEQHGEWDLCAISADAQGCFAEALPPGYTNLLDFALDFEGELNDGREVGAANLTWWLEIGLGWTADVAAFKPLSYAVIIEDHIGMVNGHQITYENYHWVPSTGEWVHYYSGRMPTSGRLVRMKHHVHMNLLERSYFLAASADELELAAQPLGPEGKPFKAKEVPGAFYSMGGRLGALFSQLTEDLPPEEAFEGRHDFVTWPVGVVSPQALGADDLASFEASLLQRLRALPGGDGRLICSLERGLEQVDGFLWDRAGRSTCGEWRFHRGDDFASVSLLRYHGGKLGPWSPNHVPARLPSHNQWNVYFEADEEASHYLMYSALIDDRKQRLRRHVLRELLLMMNWRIVAVDPSWTTQLTAATMAVRRLAPLTLLTLATSTAAAAVLACRRVVKRKRE